MKKRLVIIVGALALVVLVVNALLASRSGVSTLFQTYPTPTPVTPPTQINSSSVQLVQISPKNNAENTGLINQLTATFNTTAAGITFALYPETPFATTFSGAQLSVTFSEELLDNTIYTYSFLDKDGSVIATGRFNTGSTASGVAPLSGQYDNLESTANQAQRENNPDEFLANNTPYETSSFSVSSDFSSDGTGHFFFTVTSKSAGGKNDFLSWLTSLGFTSEQIQKLDIRYQ